MSDLIAWEHLTQDVISQIDDLETKIEKSYKILLLGLDDTGKTTFINNVVDSNLKNFQTKMPGIEISFYIYENRILQIYDMRDEAHTEDDLREFYKNADGVLGIFELQDPNTFRRLQERIAEMILKVGKTLPLVLLGNKADLRKGVPDSLKVQDVLEYSYTLADASCHRVPYVELATLFNEGYEQVLHDVVTMIECDHISKCAERPAILRNWCTLHQFKSYHEDTTVQLID